MAIHEETHAGPSSVAEAPVTIRVGAHEGVEWTAGALRPVAHWVTMPSVDGRPRLEMIWEVPNPIASHVLG